MINTILVPLDGSQLAEQGLVAACRLARRSDATIVLVRAVAFYAIDHQEESAEFQALAEAERYLEDTRRRLAEQGFTVRAELLPCDPVRAILFAARARHADIVSMSTHGEHGLRHMLLGSVAEAVLRRLALPVLLTTGSCQSAEQAASPFNSILVPLDGTTLAEHAVFFLANNKLADGADVTLLRVVTPRQISVITPMAGSAVTELYDSLQKETEHDRDVAKVYLTSEGYSSLPASTWHTEAAIGYPATEIQRAARTADADLIVMAAHGRHGLDLLLHGSVSRDVLHHATVPVLLLRGAHAPAAAPAMLAAGTASR
jgi:nucleotide-binding universal stress UspA family protein